DLMASMLLQARNCTTRRSGPGLLRGASTPHATLTRRACCPTTRSLLQRDLLRALCLLAARNCTTRPSRPGLLRGASTPHAGCPRRACCATAWCWVAAGDDSSGQPSVSAELYDPALGTWTVTG